MGYGNLAINHIKKINILNKKSDMIDSFFKNCNCKIISSIVCKKHFLIVKRFINIVRLIQKYEFL